MNKIAKPFKKMTKRLITRYMLSKGYSPHFAYKVFEERVEDLVHQNSIPLRKKIWAQKRGFLSDKIANYGLTEESYRDYLSDFDYYKLHPINGMYSRWIDDKLTMKLILHPFSDHLPDYYFQIGNGQILRLMDCPEYVGSSPEDIIELLKEKKNIAVKLFSGSAGVGFYHLLFSDDSFFTNNHKISGNELCTLINGWVKLRDNSVLATEYLSPHKELARIWPETANALRLAVIHEASTQPVLFYSSIRFGTKLTGGVDNSSSGGVLSVVNLETGLFDRGKILRNGRLQDCPYHPDSNKKIEGTVPQWNLIRQKIVEVCNYIQQMSYLGFDIVITDKGFYIIEINSHPSIEFFQTDLPAYKNPLCSGFFKKQVQRIK